MAVAGDVDEAVRVLRAGGLVAIPTETVYGLAADARNERAVQRVFAVKRRPADHPLIVHLGGIDGLDEWVRDVPAPGATLARELWPGPLTLLLHRAEGVPDIVTGGRDTVAVRVPAHPLTLAVLDRFGGGLVAPSANRFGHVSPTTAAHVRADLAGEVDLVLDAGATSIGVESTIVDCTQSPPQILRPGGISAERLERLLGAPLDGPKGPARAPGMLERHYAPTCRVVLAESRAEAEGRLQQLLSAGEKAELLDPGDDIAGYARTLYASLRAADARRLDALVAVLPRADGLGAAVRDRLMRAAAGSAQRTPTPDGEAFSPTDPSGPAG